MSKIKSAFYVCEFQYNLQLHDPILFLNNRVRAYFFSPANIDTHVCNLLPHFHLAKRPILELYNGFIKLTL